MTEQTKGPIELDEANQYISDYQELDKAYDDFVRQGASELVASNKEEIMNAHKSYSEEEFIPRLQKFITRDYNAFIFDMKSLERFKEAEYLAVLLGAHEDGTLTVVTAGCTGEVSAGENGEVNLMTLPINLPAEQWPPKKIVKMLIEEPNSSAGKMLKFVLE